MTLDDRVDALASLGLTPRQTHFIALVALHSGYCLRRQYLRFAGLRYGKNVREFLDGLVDRGLATRFEYRRDRGHLYHLCARSLYRAIDQEENRNRRHTSPALIARKLMVLDHVLGHHERDWYATEQDKVALLTERFGVPVGDLPQRVYTATDGVAGPTIRYFVHKLPLYLEGAPPVVHLAYLVTDDTGRGFEQFLSDHARPVGASAGVGRGRGGRRGRPRPAGLPTGLRGVRGGGAALDGHAPRRPAVVLRDAAARRRGTARQPLGRRHQSLSRRARPLSVRPPSRVSMRAGSCTATRCSRMRRLDRRQVPFVLGQLVTEQLPGQYAQFGELAGVV